MTTRPSRSRLRPKVEAAGPLLRERSAWLRAAIASEPRPRRIAWLVVAAVLVLGPALFNLARSSTYPATVQIVLLEVDPLPLERDPAVYQRLLADRELQTQMFLNVEAMPAEYANTEFRRTERGLSITTRAKRPERARRLAVAVADQLRVASTRAARRAADVRIQDITVELRTEQRRRERLRLFRERRALRELGPVPPAAVAPVLPAPPPTLPTWADRLADRVPGELPGRASPVWAALAGLVLFATLWTIVFLVAPPAGAPRVQWRRPRPLREPVDLDDPLPPVAVAAPAEPRRPPRREREREPVGEEEPADEGARLPRWATFLWVAALLAMPLTTLWLISEHSVNVPFWDEWSLVSIFQAQDAGRLGFDEFWTQHNEHRPVIPKFADFASAHLTDWNLQFELYRNFVVAVAGFAVIVLALRRTLGRIAFLAASVVAAVLYFSPVQWENWLWGWQLEWFLSNTAAIVALWALTVDIDRSRRRALIVAGVCGVVATFSLAQGLLIWPVGLAVLWLRRRPWRVWAALTVVVPVIHFIGWQDENSGGSNTTFLEKPARFAEFVTLYLGRSLGTSNATGKLVGAALLIAFAAAVVHVVRSRSETRLVDRAAFWVGLGGYALGAALVTGVGRVSAGVLATSRYGTMAALFAIATMALLLVVARERRVFSFAVTQVARRRALVAVTLPLLVAALVNARHGEKAMDDHGDRLDRIAACTREVTSPRDPCLRTARAAPYDETYDWVLYLRRKGWGGYEPLTRE